MGDRASVNDAGELDDALVAAWDALEVARSSGSALPERLDALADTMMALLPHRATVPDVLQPSLLEALADLLMARYNDTQDPEDLSRAIRLLSESCDLTPPEDADRSWRVVSLRAALMVRYHTTETAADLDEAIRVGADAVTTVSADDPMRPSILSWLAWDLEERYRRSENREDLDDAISFTAEAVKASPVDDTSRPRLLMNLSTRLWQRHLLTENEDDLDSAIAFGVEAIEQGSSDDSWRSDFLVILSSLLAARLDHDVAGSDLNQLVRCRRELVSLVPTASNLQDLALALSRRSRTNADSADLDDAVQAASDALDLTPPDDPDRPERLYLLSRCLSDRCFAPNGDLDDLERAITNGRDAVAITPVDDPRRAERLSGVAQMLFVGSGFGIDPSAMDAVIAYEAEAVELTPAEDPQRAERQLALARSLFLRYRQWKDGDREDLDGSIARFRDAIALLPPEDPDRALVCYQQAEALLKRYECDFDDADLDEAIACAREAVDGTPADESWTMAFRVALLARAMTYRYRQHLGRADLDEAIRLNSRMVQLVPDDDVDRGIARRTPHLVSLGELLLARYEVEKRADDLEAAFELLVEAFERTDARSSAYGHLEHCLAAVLLRRYQLNPRGEDLRRALKLAGDAVDRGTGEGGEAARLNTFAQTLLERSSANADPDDRSAALDLWRQVIASGTDLAEVVDAARRLSAVHHEHGQDAEGARVLAQAVRAGRDLVLVGTFDGGDELLRATTGLGSTAAGIYASGGHWANAIAVLEAAVSIQLGRAQGLAGADRDVDRLRGLGEDDLADRLATVLEVLRTEGRRRESSDEDQAQPYRARSAEYGGQRQELAAVREQIGRLADRNPLFKVGPWLREPTTRDITRAAARTNGPVVYLVAGEHGGIATWVTSLGKVGGMGLPGLRTGAVEELIEAFRRSSAELWEFPRERARRGPEVGGQVERLLTWCADVVLAPLLGQFGPVERLGLVPVGALAQLPLAGAVHALAGGPDVVVTVAPSGFSLSAPGPDIDDRALVAAHPGRAAPFLAQASAEAAAIGGRYSRCRAQVADATSSGGIARVPDRSDALDGLDGLFTGRSRQGDGPPVAEELLWTRSADAVGTVLDEGLADGVIADLGMVSVAHFACHGRWDPRSPRRSRLELDRDLTVEEIAGLDLASRPHVVLSACETAMPGQILPEEQIGLPVGLLQAGAGSVLASLWPVCDGAGPPFMEDYHDHLVQGVDPALALHRTQAAWATAGRHPYLWAGWLHIGPTLAP